MSFLMYSQRKEDPPPPEKTISIQPNMWELVNTVFYVLSFDIKNIIDYRRRLPSNEGGALKINIS